MVGAARLSSTDGMTFNCDLPVNLPCTGCISGRSCLCFIYVSVHAESKELNLLCWCENAHFHVHHENQTCQQLHCLGQVSSYLLFAPRHDQHMMEVRHSAGAGFFRVAIFTGINNLVKVQGTLLRLNVMALNCHMHSKLEEHLV